MARRFGVRTREIVLYPDRRRRPARVDSRRMGASWRSRSRVPRSTSSWPPCARRRSSSADAPLQIQADDVMGHHTGLVQQLLGANILLVRVQHDPGVPDGRRPRAPRAARGGLGPAARHAHRRLHRSGHRRLVRHRRPRSRRTSLLAFIGVFVFLGASQEVAFQTRREAIAGHVAHEAMITKFETLAPQDTLGPRRRAPARDPPARFPGDRRLEPHRRRAPARPTARGPRARRVATPTCSRSCCARPVQVAPATDLEAVLQHLQRDPSTPLLVVEEGALRGMVTLENLAEFIVVARQIAR